MQCKLYTNYVCSTYNLRSRAKRIVCDVCMENNLNSSFDHLSVLQWLCSAYKVSLHRRGSYRMSQFRLINAVRPHMHIRTRIRRRRRGWLINKGHYVRTFFNCPEEGNNEAGRRLPVRSCRRRRNKNDKFRKRNGMAGNVQVGSSSVLIARENIFYSR